MGNLVAGIPIVSDLVERVPSMDYEGQRLAEKVYQRVIVLFAVVGFVWGYACQQFAQTIYILGAGVVLAYLLVLPPWPFFRQHPLPWQKPQDQKTATSGGSKKKDKSKTS